MSLQDKLAALRTFFGVADDVAAPAAVQFMNKTMGYSPDGPLPQQVDRLIAATGVSVGEGVAQPAKSAGLPALGRRWSWGAGGASAPPSGANVPGPPLIPRRTASFKKQFSALSPIGESKSGAERGAPEGLQSPTDSVKSDSPKEQAEEKPKPKTEKEKSAEYAEQVKAEMARRKAEAEQAVRDQKEAEERAKRAAAAEQAAAEKAKEGGIFTRMIRAASWTKNPAMAVPEQDQPEQVKSDSSGPPAGWECQQLWVPASQYNPESEKKGDPKRTVWELAEIMNWGGDGKTALVRLGGRKITVEIQNCHHHDPSHKMDIDDAGKMADLHEAPLLKLLKQRHARDAIYTWSGETLLSINPYRLVPGLYEAKQVQGTMQRSSWREKVAKALTEELPPHIFSVADLAYQQLGSTGIAQVLVVNGESGAGKTEACRQLMHYIACASSETRRRRRRRKRPTPEKGDVPPMEQEELDVQYNAACRTRTPDSSPAKGVPSSPSEMQQMALSVSQIEHYMLQASPVLEAFGNAKTIRNNNSSRFGKFTWLLFSSDATLQGSRIETFLLEKARLTSQTKNERNYHIFYMLCASRLTRNNIGTRSEATAVPGLKAADEYALLRQGDCQAVAGIDDAASFTETVEAMTSLDFASQRGEVWMLLAGLLELGNLEFEDGDNGGCNVTDEAVLQAAAEKLGCSAVHLRAVLLERTFQGTAKSRSFSKTNVEQIGIEHTASEASEVRDAMIKHVYDVLFLWLVAFINKRSFPVEGEQLSPMGGNVVPVPATAPADRWEGPQMGLLDIYGFESLHRNSLEQLCINYANEILQQQFNERIFVLERRIYEEEGIEIDEVHFRDFSGAIELIAGKPTGIFALLEEQGRLGERGTDKAFLENLITVHLEKHAHFGKPRFGADGFTVRHFAGEITYEAIGMTKKNVDQLSNDLQKFLTMNVNGLIPTMRTEMGVAMESKRMKEDPQNRYRAPGRTSSTLKGVDNLTSKFQKQMNDLMGILQNAEPRYVRCIKPNAAQAPAAFEEPLVMDQLRYLGVMETVRIRRAGYPVRVPFKQLLTDFRELQRGDWIGTEKEILVKMMTAHLEDTHWRIGDTRIFLSDSAMRLLRSRQQEVRNQKATRIQSSQRRKVAAQRVEVLRKARLESMRKAAATAMQAQARRRAAKRVHDKLAAEKAEALRIWAMKEERLAGAIHMQSVVRGKAAREERTQRVNSIRVIQRVARGSIVRSEWTRVLSVWRHTRARTDIAHEAFERLHTKFLEPDEVVLLAGEVKRYEPGILSTVPTMGLGLAKGRHLLAFCATASKGARMVCFDLEVNNLEWEMPWTSALKVDMALSKRGEFTVTNIEGIGSKGRFIDVLGDAQRWQARVEGYSPRASGLSELLQAAEKQPIVNRDRSDSVLADMLKPILCGPR